MTKFLITFRSSNPITGDIMVTTSPRVTCPSICPLRKSLAAGSKCYAEHGHLGGFIWSGLDRHSVGQRFGPGIHVYSLKQLATAIRCLSARSVWRHNQAGDLYATNGTIDAEVLRTLVDANTARRGFTFTHHDVISNARNRELILSGNENGFRINLSANNLEHADQLASLRIAPVAAIIPKAQRSNLRTPEGRRVIICPARTRPNVTCSKCKLCTRERDFIVGLPELTQSDNRIY